MADFSVRIASGGTPATWTDPATGSAPSRLNPFAAHPHRSINMLPGSALQLRVTLAGVDGPLDAVLVGKLFLWSWADRPSVSYLIPTVTVVGQTSVLDFAAGTFTGKPGHYAILCWREGSGGVVVPWEVDNL